MIPVFVPSYHRPKATFLGRSLDYEFPMYVFVRKEDVLDYRYLTLRPNTTLVTLPRKVSNIGETRRAMIKYAVKQGIPKIFMIDDDVSRLDFSVWDSDKEVVRASGTVEGKREDFTRVLRYWQKEWELYDNCVMLGLSYRPFSWSMKRYQINTAQRAQLQQCVGVNVELIHEAGLNYQSNSVVGNEDLFLQLECYKTGLECLKTNHLQYDCTAMGAGTGGCNDSEEGSIQDKQERRVAAFLRACDRPELIKVAQTRSGVKSIKFVWSEIAKIMGE